MEATYVQHHQALHNDKDPDVLAEDNTRPSLPEDFPNFRDFQIEKMVLYFRVVTDGSEQRLRLGFKCKLCGEVFNKTMQLLGHIRNHFEENHSCKDCGKYFFDTNKLNIHKRAKHTQALKCQLGCPSYTTSNIKCLQTHYLRFHCLKIRPKDMKKMEETLGPIYRHNDNDNKVKMQREIIADQQRSLGMSQQTQSAELEENEEDEAEEQEPDQDDDEFDEPEDYGQTVECCVCDVYIPTEDALRVHQETHRSPYTCKICFTAYEKLDDARNHYESHEKSQVMQNPLQLQTVTLTPAVSMHHQQPPTSIPIATASSQPQQTPTMTTMLIMHNGTPILVPVQTFDSSQLVPAFPSHASLPAQINTQPPSGTTTITPITTAWPMNHLLPVNNQIEIIPIHSAVQNSASAAGSHQTATISQIGNGHAIPLQNVINIKQEHSQQANSGGIVITPVTTIDQHHYLRQQHALQAQLQLQQQQQQQQQQQMLEQLQYQPQS